MSEHESPTDAGSRAQGLVVVATLAGIVVLVMLLMAFSTTNTPMSVDGKKAVYSHSQP
jgi:hypothetical protein